MNVVSMTSMSSDTGRWLRFLSRWALVTVLMSLGLFAVFFGGIGFQPSDNALGAEYTDLMQAVRSPAFYRLFTVFDALSWLMMGGTLLALASVIRSHGPIRAALIAACGIGMLTGVLGGFMRLVGIGALATQYAAALPTQQSALLPSALALYEIISAHFVAGDLLHAAGCLLVASAAFALPAFPRWLAGWFILAGILDMLQGTTSGLGAFFFPVLLLTVVVGVMGLHVAIAVAFWRVSPASLSATASTSVG